MSPYRSIYGWGFSVRRSHHHSASDSDLVLTLGELILEMADGQLRKLFVRQLPSVLGYLLVKACLQIEKSIGRRRAAGGADSSHVNTSAARVTQNGGMLFRYSCAPGESTKN